MITQPKEKLIKIFFPYIILFFFNFIFFSLIFIPKIKLITTPEYGGGDENIFHYPIKFLFQEKIKNNQLLFWSNKIGGGYPLFAIIELGILNPINYLTIKLMPFDLAINSQIFIYFLILLYSSYYLARAFNLSSIISMLYALTFSFIFFNITNIIHLSHLASFCLIPLVYGLSHKIIEAKKKLTKYYLVLIFTLTFQLITGHPQYFFYSLLSIFIYFGINYLINKSKKKEVFIKFLLVATSLVIVLLLSSPQLLPTLEYLKLSNERSFYVDKSLKLINFLTLLWPFFLYNSDLNGSFSGKNFIPPWDSNFYFGLPIIILIVFFFIFYRKRLDLSLFLKQTKENIFFLFILFLFILGNNSPIYFIYEIPPFNLFRVPERLSFVFLMIFILILFFILEMIWKTKNRLAKFLIVFFSIINFFLNFYFMYRFHNFNSIDTFLINNPIIKNIKKNKSSNQVRIISPYFYEKNNSLLINNRGIKDDLFKKLELVKYSLTQNFSIFYDIASYNPPTSAFNLKRHLYLYKLIFESEQSLPIEAYANLLSIANIQYLILPHQLKDSNYFNLIEQIKKKGITFYLYELKNRPSLVYFSNKIKKIETLNEFYDLIKEKEHKIAVEEEIKIPKQQKDKFNFQYKIINYTGHNITIEAKNNVKGIMVLAENYYPGWKAYVNGKPEKILRANLAFRGLLLEPGINKIEFIYRPETFYRGLKIAIITILSLTFFSIIFSRLKNKNSLFINKIKSPFI